MLGSVWPIPNHVLAYLLWDVGKVGDDDDEWLARIHPVDSVRETQVMVDEH